MGRPSRLEALAELKKEYADCDHCYLAKRRLRVVHGEGNPEAKLVIVGDGPGTNEDRAGRPFVGVPGRCLDAALRKLGTRREEVWITNRVMCIPKGTRGGVKAPPEGPLEACFHRLISEIYTIDPRVILTMGKTATTMLVGGAKLKMGTAAGRKFRLEFPGNVVNVSYPAIATWHPSYLLRNKAVVLDDRTGTVDFKLPEAVDWFRHIEEAVRLSHIPRSF